MSRAKRPPPVRRSRRAQRRIDRRKRGRPSRTQLRRNRRESAFGYELAMLANGAPLMQVVASAHGSSDAGREHTARWRVLLYEIPTERRRRAVFEHYLRTFNGARPHGSQWRVVDAEGFVGRRYEMGWRDIVDEETGEVTGREWGRKHVAADARTDDHRAGGLSAQQGRSPRSCDRYRALMAAGKLIGREQPPRIDAETGEPPRDAWFPAGDDPQYAYGQLWLTLPPSHEMIARWLAHPAPEHPKRPKLSQNAARKARRARGTVYELAESDLPY